ncbi:MAG: carboxypeptidase-like regulatory domain-containing protein [Candidatus Bathyarchaeia archaeon]
MPSAKIIALKHSAASAKIVALKYSTTSAKILGLRYTTAPTPPPPAEYATVEGTVKSILGPVPSIISLNGIQTETDPNGAFRITNIPPSLYFLSATPKFPYNLIFKSTTQTLELTEAKTYTLDIYLPLNYLYIGGGAALFMLTIALIASAR